AERDRRADAAGRKHTAEAPASHAVDEPDQNRKRNEGKWPNIRRWQRQRRGGAGEERDQNTPPSLGQHDGMGEAGECHGWRADFDGAAAGGSLSAFSPGTRGGGGGGPPLGGAGAGPPRPPPTPPAPVFPARPR